MHTNAKASAAHPVVGLPRAASQTFDHRPSYQASVTVSSCVNQNADRFQVLNLPADKTERHESQMVIFVVRQRRPRDPVAEHQESLRKLALFSYDNRWPRFV
jgi:hypothetical protein